MFRHLAITLMADTNKTILTKNMDYVNHLSDIQTLFDSSVKVILFEIRL